VILTFVVTDVLIEACSLEGDSRSHEEVAAVEGMIVLHRNPGARPDK
jgi:hypothetical protein